MIFDLTTVAQTVGGRHIWTHLAAQPHSRLCHFLTVLTKRTEFSLSLFLVSLPAGWFSGLKVITFNDSSTLPKAYLLSEVGTVSSLALISVVSPRFLVPQVMNRSRCSVMCPRLLPAMSFCTSSHRGAAVPCSSTTLAHMCKMLGI